MLQKKFVIGSVCINNMTCLKFGVFALFMFKISAIETNIVSHLPPHPIVGGKHVNRRYFTQEGAYQLAMMDQDTYFCGASILSAKFVLTAAHCTFGMNTSQVSFRAGTTDRSNGGQILNAVTIYEHPGYVEDELDYDVAIVEVDPEIRFSKQVKSVDVAASEPNDGSVVTASGWGTMTETNDNTPRILRSVQVLLINRTLCQRLYRKRGLEITNRMICAGFLSKTGKDTCYGDSGGPLTYAGKLVGVISWGYGCGRRGYPGIYTNLNHHDIRLFIKHIANV